MKNKNDTFSRILLSLATLLFIAGVVLSFQDKPSNISTYSAAVLCLIFSQIRRFESFEGLGVKAKLKNLEESVETIISASTGDDETTNKTISIEYLAKELNLSHSSEASLDIIIRKLRDDRLSLRTSNGLAKETSLAKPTVERIIVQLYEKGYVSKAHSKSKGLLWTLSEKGKSIELLEYEK